MKSELEKAKARLARVEKELDSNRTSVIDDGWQTSRYAKKARKWDMLAQEKMKLKQIIEDESEAETYYCRACLAMLEEECACSENEEE